MTLNSAGAKWSSVAAAGPLGEKHFEGLQRQVPLLARLKEVSCDSGEQS